MSHEQLGDGTKLYPDSLVDALGFTPLVGVTTSTHFESLFPLPSPVVSNVARPKSLLSTKDREKSSANLEYIRHNKARAMNMAQAIGPMLASDLCFVNNSTEFIGKHTEISDQRPSLSSLAENVLNFLNSNPRSHEVSFSPQVDAVTPSTGSLAEHIVSTQQPPIAKDANVPDEVTNRANGPKRAASIAKVPATLKKTATEEEFCDFLSDITENLAKESDFYYFHSSRTDDPSLSNAALERIHTHLWNINDSEILRENACEVVELHHILIRALTHGSIVISSKTNKREVLNILLSKDVSERRKCLEILENSSRAAKTILDFYYSARNDFSFLPEENLSAAVDFIDVLINKVVIPIVVSDHDPDTSKELNRIQQISQKCIVLLRNFILATGFKGLTISKIQYVCSNIAFANAAAPSLLPDFQSLALAAISTLEILFRASDDQDVMLKEVLVNMDKLSSKLPRLYSTANKKISNFAALILKILRASGYTDHAGMHGTLFIESCAHAQNQCYRFASQVLTALYNHAISGSTSSGLFKSILESLIEDGLAVLYDSGWPSAENLVVSAISDFRTRATKKTNARGTVLSLELLGVIANALVPLKNFESRYDIRSLEESELLGYLEQLAPLLRGSSVPSASFLLSGIAASLPIGLRENALQSYLAQKLECLGSNDEDMTGADGDAYFAYLASRQLGLCYDSIVSSIVQALQVNTKVKTAVSKGLKMLAQLADANPNVLGYWQVQMEVKRILDDDSAQVRESAIALISAYIKKVDLQGPYLEIVLECTSKDPAVAPRKRALLTLSEIFPSSSINTQRAIIRCMLRGLSDDEQSIKKFSQETLEHHLLESWSSDCFGEENSLTTRQALRFQAQRIMDLFLDINEEKMESELAIFFMETNESANNRARLIITTVVHQIGVLDEIENALRFLALMARCAPFLFKMSHLRLLQSYPVEERSAVSKSRSRYYGLIVFRYTLQSFSTADFQFLKETKDMLMKRLSAYSILEINQAVPCLWAAVKLMKTEQSAISLARALKSSISRLEVVYQNEIKSVMTKRLCYIVGSICRYCDLGQFATIFRETSSVSKIDEGSKFVSGAGIGALLMVFQKGPNSVQGAALQNIGQICIGQPALFQTKAIEQLYDQLLDIGTEEQKESALSAISEFIELDVAEADEIARKRSNGTNRDVDISGEYSNEGSSLVIELAQRYKEKLKDIALAGEGDAAYSAAKLLYLIGKQGLTAPQEVTAVVVALMSTPGGRISAMASSAFEAIYHKHEASLPSQLLQGVKLAASRRRKLVGDRLIEEKNNLKCIYDILHPPQSRSSTAFKRFSSTIFKGLRTPIDSTEQSCRGFLDLTLFIVAGLGSLNFRSNEEVNSVLRDITATLRAGVELIDQDLSGDLLSPSRSEKEALALGLRSVPLLVLFHLQEFLKEKYLNSSTGKGSKSMRESSLELTQLFSFSDLEDVTKCNLYTEDLRKRIDLDLEITDNSGALGKRVSYEDDAAKPSKKAKSLSNSD